MGTNMSDQDKDEEFWEYCRDPYAGMSAIRMTWVTKNKDGQQEGDRGRLCKGCLVTVEDLKTSQVSHEELEKYLPPSETPLPVLQMMYAGRDRLRTQEDMREHGLYGCWGTRRLAAYPSEQTEDGGIIIQARGSRRLEEMGWEKVVPPAAEEDDGMEDAEETVDDDETVDMDEDYDSDM